MCSPCKRLAVHFCGHAALETALLWQPQLPPFAGLTRLAPPSLQAPPPRLPRVEPQHHSPLPQSARRRAGQAPVAVADSGGGEARRMENGRRKVGGGRQQVTLRLWRTKLLACMPGCFQRARLHSAALP